MDDEEIQQELPQPVEQQTADQPENMEHQPVEQQMAGQPEDMEDQPSTSAQAEDIEMTPEEDIPVDMDTAGEQQTDPPLGGDDDPPTWSLSRLRKRKAVQTPEPAQQRRKQKIATVSWLYNSF